MHHVLKGLLLAATASFLVACGGSSPLGKALDHEIAMLKILETNKTDAAKATAELEKYVKTNEATFKDLSKALKDMKTELKGKGVSAMTDAVMSHSDQMQTRSELQTKLRKDAGELMRDPKVSAMLESIENPW